VRKVIIDPYDWMPGYGESGVSFHLSAGKDLVLEITYDAPNTETQERSGMLRRSMTFISAWYFIMAPFPGADPLWPEAMPGKLSPADAVRAQEEAREPTDGKFGCLVETVGSHFLDVCKAWYRQEAHGRSPDFRHFHIEFLSENVKFHIIAKDVTLSEPVRVTSAYE
jgi:hypothetical protein